MIILNTYFKTLINLGLKINCLVVWNCFIKNILNQKVRKNKQILIYIFIIERVNRLIQNYSALINNLKNPN